MPTTPPESPAVPSDIADLPKTDVHPSLSVKTRPDNRVRHWHPRRRGAKIEVRPWGSEPGENIGVDLLWVSRDAVHARLSRIAKTGEMFEVVLWDPEGRRCGRMFAAGRAVTASPDGTATARLVFGSRLPAAVVARLSWPKISRTGRAVRSDAPALPG
jgi:hypothetical protein